MFDIIIKLGKSLVQHGPNNDRVYLMKLHPEDMDSIIDRLADLVIIKRYSKIFAKVPDWALDAFLNNHYKIEASIPEFYNGKTKVYFVSRFFNAKRSYVSNKQKEEIKKVVKLASNATCSPNMQLPSEYTIKTIGEQDAKNLAKLYKMVFKVYPFPIFNESFILKTMKSHVRYVGVYHKGQLVAASSAEMDADGKNAEMTDFATHQDHLGNNLSFFLLQHMEEMMKERGMKTLFTIARAKSIGMNKTFGRLKYVFGGTALNNTNIGTSIESMNVWYKNLLN